MTERERFEACISGPPFECDVTRFSENEQRWAWPGCYRDLNVDLAWHSWQAALASRAADVPERVSEPTPLTDEQIDAIYKKHWSRTKATPALRAAARECIAAHVPERVSEPTWSAYKDAPESHARICKLVNECAITQSALYDINLLPEQTGHDPIRWAYTIAVVEHIALAKSRAAPPAITTPPQEKP